MNNPIGICFPDFIGLRPLDCLFAQGLAGKNTGAQSARMIFSPPTRRARPCAPVGNGYLCFKEISVSFSAFYRLQLSSCDEKECLTVTHAVRFADCFRFFVSFAQETVGTA